MLFLFFVLLIPQRDLKSKGRFALFALLGTSMLAYPFFEGAFVYTAYSSYIKTYDGYVSSMSPYKNKAISFFSDSADFAFPLANLAQQSIASRFASFGWLPFPVYFAKIEDYPKMYTSYKTIMNFFITAIAEDIHRYQPKWVFVDTRRSDPQRKIFYYGNPQIAYIKLFSLNKDFKKEWDFYHFVRTVNNPPL